MTTKHAYEVNWLAKLAALDEKSKNSILTALLESNPYAYNKLVKLFAEHKENNKLASD